MATTRPLRTLFEALRRQHRAAWTLPEPEQLAAAVQRDERVRRAVEALTRALVANRLDFRAWQAGVSEALRRGGVDVGSALAAGAAVGLLAGAALAARRTPQDALAQLEAAFTRRVTAHTQALAAGELSVAEWRAAFAAELDAYHPAAAIVGAGGRRDAVVLALGRQRALSEREFLDVWANELEGGRRLSEAQMTARARLYAGAARGTLSQAQAVRLGLALPFFPAIGTICRTQCGCFWDIQPVEGGYDCYWRRGKDDSCPTCLERERIANPIFIEAAQT